MTQRDPRLLLVIAFDAPLKAREAMLALQRLQQDGALLVHDAVFIDADSNGVAKVTETIDLAPSDAALRSGFWGALIGTVVGGPIGTLVGGAVTAAVGAVAAKLIDVGVPDATVEEVKQAITPGWTGLALLVSHMRKEVLERELTRFPGGRIVMSTLSPTTVQTLRNAMAAPAAE